MTELERALLHIKTRADAWAVKEVEKAIELDYKVAFQIACALLNGDILYGMDAESIFSEIMKKDGCVCSLDYENYILTHLNELRDDKSLSQEPCDDAISRDAILDALLDYWHDIQFVDGSGYNVYEDCKAVIDELPSVTQKSGKWKYVPDADGFYICSECGCGNGYADNFCPQCGAKMVELQESEG